MTVILVSVDIYRSEAIGNLRSTSSDGDKLRRYFRDILGVPEERILELRDLAATREAIMTAIEGLLTNGTIRPGDRIVFYFAGHGTLVKAPTGWEAVSGNISMIVPSDCLAVNTAGKRIAPIPYRTLKALFGQLVRDKGVSVSVILDCCRSNSSLRQLDGAPLDWARMFSHENSFDLGGHCWIPADLDKKRWANDDGAQWASSQKQAAVFSLAR